MSRPAIVWLLREVVEAIHDEQIAWHGGQDGIRDAGLLMSALTRPRNLAVEAFLLLNGLTLTASDADCVLTIERLAEGSLSEADFATWIRVNV